MKNIRQAGFNTLQLWVLWSWVESQPGKFDFSDYDRLVEMADAAGLKLVMSVIPELQPLWIHRIIPGSEMLNHLRHKEISANRDECHFGITPGGCFDHPEVWRRMQNFLRAVAGRYKDCPNLYAWDAWNELRWNEHAQGLVCFCVHTLKCFREWLEKRYNGLDGLNRAWQRRYVSWEDVMPGWAPNRPFTETMAFQFFLTERANEHGRRRYAAIKAVDPAHPITVHGGSPSVYWCGGEYAGQTIMALDRGNDWAFADHLDGVGCSSFPKWGQLDWADFAVRMEIIRSAAGKKPLWLSELQGGSAAQGFSRQEPVRAVEQQHWIWNGIAAGAKTALFWCWKDEKFTTEAGGFGVSGLDGYAAERIAAFQTTCGILERHKNILDEYCPIRPEIGIYFSPQSAYLHWCNNISGEKYLNALLGYGKSLIRENIPFEMIEEEHLDELQRLKVLFMPRALVVDDKTADKLLNYVSGGGTLVVESECGAFDERGIYRYPENRFLNKLGICELGRRTIAGETIRLQAAIGKKRLALTGTQWVTPYKANEAQRWAGYGRDLLAGEIAAGKGRIIFLGTYLGEAYLRERAAGFEDLLRTVCLCAGWEAGMKIAGNRRGDFYIRAGACGEKRVFFVFCEGKDSMGKLTMTGNSPHDAVLRDLISNNTLKGTALKEKNKRLFKFRIPKERLLVLVEG